MKVFIAGSRHFSVFDEYTYKKLRSICDKGYAVLVGDCYGADTLVQRFFSEQKYRQVTVYASLGRVRNNAGNWMVKTIPIPKGIYGYRLYEFKDIEMANETDIGFMIWDGESRGTRNNIERLVNQRKPVLVHLPNFNKTYMIHEGRTSLVIRRDRLKD